MKWSRRNRAASRAIAAALATLLVGGGFALWQARRAGLEALEAARLGAEAAQLQELMRVEMLLPAHDLSPAYQRIRQAMAALSARPPVVAAGAAAFTLGRGHQLLGDDREAHRELTRAWELGFRRPEAARALAETEGRLYARELAMLGGSTIRRCARPAWTSSPGGTGSRPWPGCAGCPRPPRGTGC